MFIVTFLEYVIHKLQSNRMLSEIENSTALYNKDDNINVCLAEYIVY